MKTNIGYCGKVDITLKDKNGYRVCRYHNAGTKFLFQKIVSFLMGGTTGSDKVLFLNAVGVAVDDNNNPQNYELLDALPILSARGDSGGTDSKSYMLVCTGAISYRDINQTNLQKVISGNGTVYLTLISADVAGKSDETKMNLDYAYATMEVDQSFLPSIESGVQAIVEWKMIFSNSEGDE